MTILESLADNAAFVHTELPVEDIQYLFKPFQEITDDKLESNIMKAVERRELTVVNAGRGCGKTSSVIYSLLSMPKVFPIILSPIIEDPRKVCESPEQFVRFLLSQVLENVTALKKIDDKVRSKAQAALALRLTYVESRKEGIGGRIKGVISMIPAIVSLGSEVSSDIETYTSSSLERKTFNADRIGSITDLCGTIEKFGYQPVFFIDDTDKFLRGKDFDRSALVPKFFGGIVPVLVKIDKAFVIAAHPEYYDSDTFKKAADNDFDRVFQIPSLKREAVSLVLEKRIQAVLPDSRLRDVFDEDAITYLHQVYGKTGNSLRSMMLKAREGLDRAINLSEDRITAGTLKST